MKILKKLGTAILIAVMITSALPLRLFAAQILYNQVRTDVITKGVTYQLSHRLTPEGWQDIHVMNIDLKNPNIKLAPVESSEIALKDNVLNMITNSGALGGVNADFFGLRGNYSASFGLTMSDGELISAGTDRNKTGSDWSTFFIDKEGNPFIDFFSFTAEFYSGEAYLELASVNKITEMIYPIYYNATPTTEPLDARFPELVKITVKDGVISSISQKGEIVSVPEDGYLIIISSKYYDDMNTILLEGQKADIYFQATLDMNNIDMAISGGGRILRDGQEVREGTIIDGRQPRTALGITEDGNNLIIMVVDGRGHSIGATHSEMAGFMREYGAYNAMHFDGGGSSTMVAKTLDDNSVVLKNNVSEGTQRRVANALGVFDNAVTSSATQLVIKPTAEKIFIGNQDILNIYALDDNFHKIYVPIEEVNFSTTNGTIQNGILLPNSEGECTINAQWNGINAETTVDVMLPASIDVTPATLSLSNGQSVSLSVNGISTEGFSGFIDESSVIYEISNPEIGTMTGNTFVAASDGTGYIKCTLGDASAYVKVAVGGQSSIITSFEDMPEVTFSAYPAEMISGVAGASSQFYNDGNTSLELRYALTEATATQAAYINFVNPISIPGNPTALRLSIYGNQSGDWVRGKIKDATGKEEVIDFTRDINWSGWQETQAQIPSGLTYPITLETIYMASLSNTDTNERVLYFDKLLGIIPFEATQSVPANTKVPDKFSGNVLNNGDGAYYIAMAGNVVSSEAIKNQDLYEAERIKVYNNLQNTSNNLAVYAGKSDITAGNLIDTIKWSGEGYNFYSKNNTSIIELTAAKGSIRATNPYQWTSFESDAINSSNKNVIFIMDRTPSEFTVDSQEIQLFQDVLDNMVEAGKNVFVVSSSGTREWTNVKNGVRYINLPNLWNSDGSVNNNFKILKFKVLGDSITYELTSIQ